MPSILITSKKYGTKEVLFSEEDRELVESKKWFVSLDPTRGSFVVTCNDYSTKPYKHPSMSRLIMGEPRGKHVDHINHNTLDNRRGNLRVVDPKDNAKNKRSYKRSVTGYKGIFQDKNGRYTVKIQSEGVRYEECSYSNLKHALIRYNQLAREMHGEFACLHQIEEDEAPIRYQWNKSTGVRGITFLRGHYQAMFYHKNKPYYVGFFDTLEEAKQKLEARKKEIGLL